MFTFAKQSLNNLKITNKFVELLKVTKRKESAFDRHSVCIKLFQSESGSKLFRILKFIKL